MQSPFKDAAHLARVAVLFVIAIAAFLLVQRAVVPSDFGRYGPFRAGALNDVRAKPLRYAGQESCHGCHGDQLKARASGRHALIACEACHGPLARHADDPTAMKPAKPNSVALCARCHEAIAGKPKFLPQVDTKEHSVGVECNACHNPHQPKPKI